MLAPANGSIAIGGASLTLAIPQGRKLTYAGVAVNEACPPMKVRIVAWVKSDHSRAFQLAEGIIYNHNGVGYGVSWIGEYELDDSAEWELSALFRNLTSAAKLCKLGASVK